MGHHGTLEQRQKPNISKKEKLRIINKYKKSPFSLPYFLSLLSTLAFGACILMCTQPRITQFTLQFCYESSAECNMVLLQVLFAMPLKRQTLSLHEIIKERGYLREIVSFL